MASGIGEPLRFDAFMELALYGEPGGFYASGRGAGRRGGDFLTSVEVGPLFGRLVARLADRCWEEMGRPTDFTLVDVGAGTGTLARSVLTARPACAGALRYVLVERSTALRRAHEDLLERPPGPCVRLDSLADLPEAPITGVVLANELLDNLSCRLLERTSDGWAEVYVTADVGAAPGEMTPGGPHCGETQRGAPVGTDVISGAGASITFTTCEMRAAPVGTDVISGATRRPAGSGWGAGVTSGGSSVLAETLCPLPAELQATATSLAPGAPIGGRIPLASTAVAWVGRALNLLHRGTLVVIDYTNTSASLAARPPWEWVRTYRCGVRGHDPLREPGSTDITVEVPLDQILSAHPGAQVCDQATFLASLGIDDLVAEGRAVWQERAPVGDLAALEARSRVHEAQALCDPSGLGIFSVMTWRHHGDR